MMTFEQFEILFDKLQAAFCVTRTSKIIEQWYQEFKDCDYFAFCKAISRLKLNDKFPNWGMVWTEYRNCLGPIEQRAIQGCDVCQNGKIFHRAYNRKVNEVKDSIGSCLRCAPGLDGLPKVNPERLHKDRIGVLRLPDALQHDRKTGWLKKENDLDLQMNQIISKPIPEDIVTEVFGEDDPQQEEIRRKNIYKESKLEEREVVPF